MITLADHWAGDGPGPWILLFPLVWAAVLFGAFWLLRRTVWRGGRCGPRGNSPVTLLGRRYANGDIDEEEYRRRLAVLTADARGGKGRAAG